MEKEKILIATKNKDKFDIVKRIIESVKKDTYEILSLYDIENVNKEEKESGSIEERALNKAKQVYKNNKNDFEYIIGIDDGIIMKGTLIEDIKKYIKDIIEDKYLKEGEKVEIHRAYCFMKKDGDFETIVTKIPFKYKKAKEKINLKENTYPLSNVLTHINGDTVVSQMDKEYNNQYYLKYSEESIKKVFEK